MKKLCIITTMWSSVDNWIRPFINEYYKYGIDITIICNMDKTFADQLKEEHPHVHTYTVCFPRGISIRGSIKSILILYRYFRENHFDMVQYSTPNASAYAAIASKIAKVPVRLYSQWGMVFVTMTGFKRYIFRCIEIAVCRYSTEVQPDSKGNLKYCRKLGMYNVSKSRVIWNGGAKGIDLSVFDINKKGEYAREIRTKYGIKMNSPVIGFVGRLGREKGCNELFKAFRQIKAEFVDAKLLFVGPMEKEMTIEPELLEYFKTCEDIIKPGRVGHVEKYYSAMDVFVLPSYREGFGISVLEASAMQVPVIVTKYPGPSCAMMDKVTGYSVDVKDVTVLIARIRELLTDPDMAAKMGRNGRAYVEQGFDQKVYVNKYMANRMCLIGYDNIDRCDKKK